MTEKKLLMGNEAIALGALEAGVQVVTGYPGTPSTEALETVIRYADRCGIYVEWSSNEKVALETAVGAAYSGAKALVTMKQVGLNVASDPLMSLSYIGVKGALVLLVADDPGPHSSQTEQDTRVFGHFANIPVLDPATPQEAYELTKLAFELSHEFEIPVILRTTTRVSHSCGDVEVAVAEPEPVEAVGEGFVKDRRWTIFPRLTAERHPWLESIQAQLSERFSELPFNTISGSGRIGILASGVSALYVKEAVETVSNFEETFTLFKIGIVHPFPEKAVLSFLRGIDRLIVAEELDPYLEEQVLQLIGKAHLPVDVYGKKNGFFPVSGEYNVDLVIDSINDSLAAFGESLRLSHASPAISREKLPPLPIRAPTLCAGCMHRTVFYAFKQAAKQLKKEAQIDTIFSGDIGCYTLGNAYPLNMVDTCLCMGAGISIAGGLFRTNPKAKHVAFIGDSTFFHSGIPAVVNAVYNGADITLAVLDNRTTAMTGHQPHPGMGLTALGSASKAIEIADVVRSCGVEFVKTVNTLEADSLVNCVKAAKEAMNFKGPSVIVFKGRCAGITKSDRYYRIKSEDCTGCGFCIKELGCPAINLDSDKPVINDSCIGCGLCAQICPSEAICIGGEKL
ncbi:indolepyruvate ferredoxin oxidoreductase alpha subunit [Methanosarcina thermophila]|uniref:Indolepyruvate oxidoreductase subunit IorA n=3 Tax=Methanosarcina thermophila TaxID=2210 RepID=A0A1I6ZUB0_METTE|nr:indolepyruvate ferredoxin oxidoreductase subunit alpha [Methanosarcina thermophila]ALK06049.1 MAG: indolepyruvate oxidoreductase [Methanosarcina sp. 795]AKB12364.1 Indolepyruvate oxidoreductase subunit IorA [Methanosarcina thermophila TM-1]AKB14432.1 Indolepyruvate oxidoreductase subunit IorA [Methanosarcina thermophila CHTI-55]NLU57057.1 indolepyruvate ferredoxin oxidoreductase subunit alpha [Methanosarcina thermophila]SFT66274.1 indolepyruvate ferredoxin oxidoreductase alpha subunit [Meth